MQTSVCTLTLSQRRAVASRIGTSPEGSQVARAYISPGDVNTTGDRHGQDGARNDGDGRGRELPAKKGPEGEDTEPA